MREFTDRHLYIFSNRRLKRIRIIRQSMRYNNDKDTIQIDMERNRNTVKKDIHRAWNITKYYYYYYYVCCCA